MARPLTVFVSGMVAGDPDQGGASWAVLQYVLGFERLGHDVFLVEPLRELRGDSVARFRRLARSFGLEGRAALVAGGETVGLPYSDVRRVAARADVLLNVSGMLRDETLRVAPIRVYLDLDPAFNQLWQAQGIDAGFEGHTHHVTVGSALGRPDCAVPTCGLDWVTTLPPVVLELWRPAARLERDALTTVANWRGYGSIEYEGIRYGQKAHSLRRFLDLPALTGERFQLALAIHPDESDDLEALRTSGFELVDPPRVAGSPAAYRRFVRGSKAEFGIAKEGYVVSRCGWFSDRSACYLASARPVIAQQTGFSEVLPTGAGLFAFDRAGDVVAAVEELRKDYGRHARAARAMAEEYFDSDRVLTRLLECVGAQPVTRPRAVHEASEGEIAAALAPVGIVRLRRRPSAYRSSFPIAEVDAELTDGSTLPLLVKDLGRNGLLQRGRRAKPSFLHDPLREIETYRRSLATAGLGTATFYGAAVDSKLEKYWLFLERVSGVELDQIGELEIWQEAARWLARLHDAGLTRHERLITYDRDFYGLWFERARGLGVDLPRRWDQVAERLAELPRTLVHGEAYAPNVLAGRGRTCLVDWELAGIGPGALDLAALVTGWEPRQRESLLSAYADSLRDRWPSGRLEEAVACARLHLAVRWLGWGSEWTPPPEHARDWLAEARGAAEELGL